MPMYNAEYTDLFAGEPNYSWVRRTGVEVPDLTHYGYDGCYGYTSASAKQLRAVLRAAKKRLGLTGVRGVVTAYDCTIEFRPYKLGTVLICTFSD